ncbi:MAG: ABC transporter ATP-binding protein [Chloroflexi bacterium]|nr:MAG: ABC transporter ATP-binding protein [Chloroflexota bacterium]
MKNSTILEMRGVRKSFGTVVALDDVSLQLDRREIHGLLGGNGAGKTTLMNILYGLYKPDAGEIYLHGRKVGIHSPKDAIRLGIGMVHQHFLQVESYTVAENIVLGTPLKNWPTLSLEAQEQKIQSLSERFGLEVDPRARIEELPMGVRQKVEILKALYRGVEILILDEPTTNLTPQEVDSLFQSLKAMVEDGMSVVFITHKLREVLSVCDRISVLRDGRNVLTTTRDEASEESLVRAMVGEGLDIEKSVLFSAAGLDQAAREVGQKPVVQVQGLRVVSQDGVPLVQDCSFQVREKEILGIAGVAGNGQKELAESLVGIRPIAGGRVLIDGIDVTQTDVRDLLARGVAYIPEDRLQDGFLPAATVAQNLILGAHRHEPYSRGGFLDWKAIFRAARQLIVEYDIKTTGPGETAANLSGGNIQRVMLARAFSRPVKFLVAHNPTRGLDIRSMEFVYSKLVERKKQGMATLLLSEDLDELLLLCDRIATIYRGEIVGLLDRHEFDTYEIGRMMSGVR